jgi:uncharacterized membrane protein
MEKDRLAAFSDGVIAIIITIMVLELHPPHGATLDALLPLWPSFFSYVLSFLYVAIYWNNHHHMVHTINKVDGRILWANMHLLFWMSLIPFTTAWMGENHFTKLPTAVYGIDLLFSAIAYFILQGSIIHQQGKNSILARAIGDDFKGRISPWLYLLGVALSFWSPAAANAVYAGIAFMWLVPDRRIERTLVR